MEFSDVIPVTNGKTFGEAQRAVLKTETELADLKRQFNDFRAHEVQRDADTKQALNAILAKLP